MHPLLEKKGFIVDVDGVVGRGDTPIPEGVMAVNRLRKLGKRIVFVSNNSTRSRRILFERLRRFGLEIKEEEIIVTTHATAVYIRDENKKARVYTTGEEGLKDELRLAGLEIVDYDEADYLVVGLNRYITYSDIKKALRLCLRNDVRYIATNPDRLYPAEDGPIPGTGMIVGALYWMTGREPDVIIGKPSRVIMEQALKTLGLEGEEVAVIGDQLDVDVPAGKEIKADTALVLTGVTTEKNLNELKKRHGFEPDYVLRTLNSIFGD